VFELLDVAQMTPLVHVSSRYPASRHCLTVVAPLALHPSRPGEVIVYDLGADPTDLLTLDVDDIADRVFTARADLPEGVERIALRTVRANRAPALAPLSVLKDADLGRLQLDLDRCLARVDTLRQAAGLRDKVQQLFRQAAALPKADDPELALYDGFLPDADKKLLAEVRGTPPEELGTRSFPFRDPRYPELLFRYRARNWPHTLDADERARWDAFRRDRLTRPTPLTTLTLDDYTARLDQLRHDPARADRHALFDQLAAWGDELRTDITPIGML
jgi:exodeoxyribonuclease I